MIAVRKRLLPSLCAGRHREVFVLACAIASWLGAPSSARGQARVEGVRPEAGEIATAEARSALRLEPVVLLRDGSHQRLDPAGFTAHLGVSDWRLDSQRFPCARWFLAPTAQSYRVWIEGPGWIGAATVLVDLPGGGFDGSGLWFDMPVVAAGQVFGPPEASHPDRRLWMLHLEPPPRSAGAGVLTRLDAVADGQSVAMPAGQLVAGVFDFRRNAFLALSRPAVVEAGGVVEVATNVPAAAGHVLVRLDRSQPPAKAEDFEVELGLEDPTGRPVPPDLVVESADEVFGVWYDVAPGPVRLRGGSGTSGVIPGTFEVRAGEVTYFEGALVPKPRLDVHLDLPVSVARESLVLELRRVADGSLVGERVIDPGVATATFEAAPLELLRLDLRASIGTFDEIADLRDGRDREVMLSPELISLHGRVFHGDDPHPARLELMTIERKRVEVTTGADGRYAVTLLEPVRFVTVFLEGPEGSRRTPQAELFPRALDSSRELDFHLSDVVLKVSVVDAMTQEPIQGARVGVRSKIAGGDQIVQRLTTDEAGEVLLPPPREGLIQVHARADGYAELAEPLTIEVDEGLQDAAYRLALAPLGEMATLRLRLPSGRPAAGAQVTLLGSSPGAERLAMAKSDAHGAVALPRSLAGSTALVTHPESAFLIEEWQPSGADAPTLWSLPVSAPRPLRLDVLGSGEERCPFASVALWIDGVRLEHGLLTLITGGPSQTDGQGRWVGSGLPPVAISVAAARSPTVGLGSLESIATRVGYPWPDPLVISAIE